MATSTDPNPPQAGPIAGRARLRPRPGSRRVGTGAKPWLSGPWPDPIATRAPAAMAATT